jgi:hypothetical protein
MVRCGQPGSLVFSIEGRPALTLYDRPPAIAEPSCGGITIIPSPPPAIRQLSDECRYSRSGRPYWWSEIVVLGVLAISKSSPDAASWVGAA